LTVAPAIIHVESPRTIRNLKQRLEGRKAEIMTWFLNASDWDQHNRVFGQIKGIEDALSILDEIEKREQN
jgi:hypothetical protein